MALQRKRIPQTLPDITDAEEQEMLACLRSGSLAGGGPWTERVVSTLRDSLGVADVIVPEPRGGAHLDPVEAARLLRNVIIRELLQIQMVSPEKLVKSRYKRFRYVGSRAPLWGGIFAKQTAQLRNLFQGEKGEPEESEEEAEVETGEVNENED